MNIWRSVLETGAIGVVTGLIFAGLALLVVAVFGVVFGNFSSTLRAGLSYCGPAFVWGLVSGLVWAVWTGPLRSTPTPLTVLLSLLLPYILIGAAVLLTSDSFSRPFGAVYLVLGLVLFAPLMWLLAGPLLRLWTAVRAGLGG